MYVILVYDVDQKRVGKMLKLCRRYLHWIQNSVFEGGITEVKLKELVLQARGLREEKDNLMLFRRRYSKWLEKDVCGVEKNTTDNVVEAQRRRSWLQEPPRIRRRAVIG